MTKKLTYEFVKSSFEKFGYTLLSKRYKNAHIKLDYICPAGHKHSTKWNHWQRGRRCPTCAGVSKLTIKYVRKSFEKDILFEDEMLLIINKPSGFAVHGGTGVTSGVIEGLRQLRPEARFLELVHRLDRDTSGCLMVAKKRSALRHLHELFRGDAIQKTYLALLAGQWARKKQLVNVPLLKNVSKGGERMVVVSQAGKAAETLFRRIKMYKQATLVEASPKTGRTHQIRVHAAFLNHPIIGDERYGIEEINREFKKRGFKRLFLHAQKLVFKHPLSGQMISVTAPVPGSLQELLADEE